MCLKSAKHSNYSEFSYSIMWLHSLIVSSAVVALGAADGDSEFANYTVTNRRFPDGFKFGVATAAHQIEGAWNLDGKGPSVWDTFFHEHPERVDDGSNGDVATDSYHLYKEDIRCMKEVGVDYYRFSLAWSRILPDGTINNINQAGIDYYVNVFKELKANGIKSFVTIHHWDIPTALEKKGGWLNPEVIDWYVAYAKLCYEAFGEYVDSWVTINEPKQICHAGYGIGGYAPGVNSNGIGEYVCAKNLLLAHAKAWRLWDQQYRPIYHTRNTIVIDSDWYEPASQSKADAIAAEIKRQFVYGMYVNPLVHGNWPKVMIDNIAKFSKKQGFNESRLPAFSNEEIELIKGTYDYLALNHYTSFMVNSIPEPTYVVSWDDDSGVATYQKNTWQTAAIGWFKVVPWGFGKLLRWIKHTYGDIEIVISENGVSDKNGTLQDEHRINYIKNYMSHLLDAIHDGGVNVTSYTLWSIIDNFEWTQGFNGKLGIYYVNQSDPSLPRIAKDSSKYFSKVIKTKCLVDECV